MSRKRKQSIYSGLLLVPVIGATIWSTAPALRTIFAIATCQVGYSFNLEKLEPWEQLKLRRDLQRYLSDRDTYIPLEDIEWNDSSPLNSSESGWTMQVHCDRARLLVWIPLRFKIPIIGEKVVEWCWIPQTRTA